MSPTTASVLNNVFNQSAQVSVFGFLTNMALAAVLSLILAAIYVRYGRSISNRRLFARNFILITLTTMFIITVVKSSLALSLGLVGALSIIRFRTAIKEPEELAYLFLAISLGLGLGAGQTVITIAAFFAIILIIFLLSFSRKKEKNQNLYLTVASNNPNSGLLAKITETLKQSAVAVDLKRFDETSNVLEASYLVEFANFEQLNKSKAELKALDNSLKISFLDNKGIQ